MDHAINSLKPFLEVEIDFLKEEWSSGKYENLSDCPSYEAVQALVKASNALRDYQGWERLRIKNLVESY